MYIVTVTAGPNSSINVQDPYPTEDKVVIEAGPGETVVEELQDSQYDRLYGQLEKMKALGLLTYTALNGPASVVANDSGVPGTTVADALDNLAGGVTGASDMMIGGGRAGSTVSNVYLRGPGNVPMNLAGYVVPFDAKIVGISAACRNAQTWTMEVRKNNNVAVIASITLTAVERDYDNTLDINIDAGDELQFYCNGLNINAPSGSVILRRR